MCGIVGVFEYGCSEGAIGRELLVRMRDTLRHRGPDGDGLFISEDARVGFGHRRLAIVDVRRGAQPMIGEHGDVLVYNGEIYNFPKLRSQLKASGARFRTDCDTEVVLRLFERHGQRCVKFLEGQFAFAIWSPQRRELFFARDPIGEKPLYWADTGGRLIFASEIKALLAHPGVEAAVNEQALSSYLTNLVTSSPATLYRGIFKLPPGAIGVCDRNGPRIEHQQALFTPRRWSRPDPAHAAVRVRELLERSVHDRLMADVPVGVLLSGGLDSTTILALLRERSEGLATFSVGYLDQPDLDERAQARRVARHFGTDHHEVVLTEREAIKFLPRLVHHQDEPLADPVCLPLHFVCELAAREGVKVVLGGEGADELFWGYPRYAQILAHWRWIRMLLALPSALRRQPARLAPERLSPYGHELLRAIGRGRLLPAHLPLGLSGFHRRALLKPQYDNGDYGWAPSDLTSTDARDPLEQLAFDTQEYEFALRLPELLLMRIDRFSMANSIEARVPFLAPELVDFVYRLPLSEKLAGHHSKIVLKRAVADLVPDWVIQRRKQGFGAPVASWMGSRLGDGFRDLLSGDALRTYFDVAAIERLLAASRSSSLLFSLWPIMNFALWHRHWIEGEAAEALPIALSRP